ncbi:Bug family tripartite tricarboxylate transporter substrate binding protein [Roseomonas sp. BN140053]|uniref:Bug family tripartite tricarboxylate transporter substrate binding protein n=1 Tax=Roseomonas sp. BN140053 TaxID=3391898 RepID=UPI0039E7F852
MRDAFPLVPERGAIAAGEGNAIRIRPGRRALLLGALGAAAARPALAAFPERSVRWLVGYAAGGGTDILARLIGGAMAPRLGQPVVVDNRPGAAATLAAEAAAKATPDGHTVFSADNGALVNNIALFRRLSYDPVRELRPVGLFADYALVLAVKRDSAIRDGQGYLEAARREPGTLACGSSGVGSPQHLAMERFAKEMGVRLSHVPYRGGAPAVSDMLAGNLESVMIDLASVGDAVRTGAIRPVAAATPQRIPSLPEVPTIRELGLPNYSAPCWQGMVVASATPDAVVSRLWTDLRWAMEQPAVRDRMTAIGVEPLAQGPDEFAAQIAADRAVWVPLIRELGITLDG